MAERKLRCYNESKNTRRRCLCIVRRPWGGQISAPTVSIIVPVYCVEEYLKECVDSIYAQDFTDWELILIDDASPDGSGTLADALAAHEPRTRVIHLKENGGQALARNRGIEECRGRYLTFIDSDDFVAPNYLSTLVHTAQDQHADVVCMSHARYHQKTDGSWYVRLRVQFKDARITDDKKQRMQKMTEFAFNATPWGKLFSHQLFKDSALRFEPILSEDILFHFRLLYEAGTYISLSKIGYYYRQTKNSTVHATNLEKSRKAMESLMTALHHVELYLRDMPDIMADRALTNHIRSWFANAFLNWLWLRVSNGLNGDQVVAQVHDIFEKEDHEHAGLLIYLFDAWLEKFKTSS